MGNYQALYRVWRPQKFSDIIGQDHITRTLTNALSEGRLSHAYLFNGPRGTGKTTAAKLLARAINCENKENVEPCNQCDACQGIMRGSVVDVIEIDAASNRGVEEIRDIRDKVRFSPAEVRYKVYIIDEVHMLTSEAFNALLKTLEEPPPHVVFVLATTEPHKLPLTIVSRCQRFDFRRIPAGQMVERMKFIAQESGVEVSEQALMMIARIAEGGMRDALSLLDQAMSFCGDRVELEDVLTVTGAVSQMMLSETVQRVLDQDISGLLEIIDDLIHRGKNPEHFLQDIIHYYRDLLLYKTAPQLSEVKERALLDERFPSLAEKYDTGRLHGIIEQLNQAYTGMKWSRQPRILLEMAFIKICQPEAVQAEDGQMNHRGEVSSNIHPEAIMQLRKRIGDLEQQIQQLAQKADADSGEKPRSRQHLQQESGTVGRSAPLQRGIPSTVKFSRGKIEQAASQQNEELLHQLKKHWSEILEQIKKKKIQVHAWFLDGEPVAATSAELVVAFKSPIHRETTEKPEHKQIIEDVLQSFAGQPIALLTLMENQWREISESLKQEQAVASEDSSAGQSDPASEEEDPLVREAIQLFGEDLVEIKD